MSSSNNIRKNKTNNHYFCVELRPVGQFFRPDYVQLDTRLFGLLASKLGLRIKKV